MSGEGGTLDHHSQVSGMQVSAEVGSLVSGQGSQVSGLGILADTQVSG